MIIFEGDSRAVLCRRDGKALALSTDHKPSLKIESDRITRAGKGAHDTIYDKHHFYPYHHNHHPSFHYHPSLHHQYYPPSIPPFSIIILPSGGFINHVGRINGNLNLSRSLGDLKYKQLFHLKREEQIISAEPDITITDLEEGIGDDDYDDDYDQDDYDQDDDDDDDDDDDSDDDSDSDDNDQDDYYLDGDEREEELL